MMYYVETFRPAYPQKKARVRVHSEREYQRDALSPSLTALFEVSATSKSEALALVTEHAAGFCVPVRLAAGGLGRTR